MPYGGYSPKGELLHAVVDGKLMDGESQVESYTRTYMSQYDELGQLTAGSISAPDEWGGNSRGFTYEYNLADGTYTRTGPDDVETFVQLDAANRVALVRRGPEADPVITAGYYYTEVENGLLDHIAYGNGTKTVYTYDAARRLVAIDHQNPLEETVLKLAYEYTINDLVASITETGSLGWRAAVKFTYDNRGRLIREARYDADPARDYHVSYEYDQGGNRTRKIRSLGGCNRIETVYHYDYEDPYSGSYNNRLMYYETYETCRVFEDYGHTGGCGTEELVSTTWYYYNDAGNVTHVVTEKENPAPEQPGYEATRLEYARNGRAVTYVLGETWNKSGGQIVDYEITYAREFRYDSARQRYMNRALDPDALEGGSRVPLSSVWSDYDGDEIYGDFEIDGQTITEVRSFELGLAKVDPWATVGGADTSYYHTDMIGTTRFMTDWTGDDMDSAVYTAFGERVSGTQHRYGYAGALGYEASSSDDPQDPYLEFPPLHVNPYYDPPTGRSLQRNASGIGGGLNVYVHAMPSGRAFAGLRASQSDENVIDAIRRIDEMLEEAQRSKAVQRIEELTVEKNRLLKELLRSKIKDTVKKGGKRAAKGLGGKAVPLIGAIFFACDWYTKGFKEAVAEATWPVSSVLGPPGTSGGGSDPYKCFVAGTLVHTNVGLVPVEVLTLGDRVWTMALDEGARKLCTRSIVYSLSGDVEEIATVEIPGEEISCSPGHRFWTEEGGWTRAGDLEAGDTLWTIDGSCVLVLDVTLTSNPRRVMVYNVEVLEHHHYFVGHAGVLVHNWVKH